MAAQEVKESKFKSMLKDKERNMYMAKKKLKLTEEPINDIKQVRPQNRIIYRQYLRIYSVNHVP